MICFSFTAGLYINNKFQETKSTSDGSEFITVACHCQNTNYQLQTAAVQSIESDRKYLRNLWSTNQMTVLTNASIQLSTKYMTSGLMVSSAKIWLSKQP